MKFIRNWKASTITVVALMLAIAVLYQNCAPAKFSTDGRASDNGQGHQGTVAMDVTIKNGAGLTVNNGASLCQSGITSAQAHTVILVLHANQPISNFFCSEDTPVSDHGNPPWNCNAIHPMFSGGSSGVYTVVDNQTATLEYANLIDTNYQIDLTAVTPSGASSTDIFANFKVEPCSTTTTTSTSTTTSSTTTTASPSTTTTTGLGGPTTSTSTTTSSTTSSSTSTSSTSTTTTSSTTTSTIVGTCGHALKLVYTKYVSTTNGQDNFAQQLFNLNDTSHPTLQYSWNEQNFRYHDECGNGCGNGPGMNRDAMRATLQTRPGSTIVSCRVQDTLDDSSWVSCMPGWVNTLNTAPQTWTVNTDDIHVLSDYAPACHYWSNTTPPENGTRRLAPVTDTSFGAHKGTYILELTDDKGCVQTLTFDFEWTRRTGSGRFDIPGAGCQ